MQCTHAHPTPTPTPTFNPTPAPDQVAAYKSEDDPDKKDRALTALVPFLQYLAITRPPDLAAEMEDVRKQFPDVPLAEACELKLAELRAAGKLQEHPPTHTHTLPLPSVRPPDTFSPRARPLRHRCTHCITHLPRLHPPPLHPCAVAASRRKSRVCPQGWDRMGAVAPARLRGRRIGRCSAPLCVRFMGKDQAGWGWGCAVRVRGRDASKVQCVCASQCMKQRALIVYSIKIVGGGRGIRGRCGCAWCASKCCWRRRWPRPPPVAHRAAGPAPRAARRAQALAGARAGVPRARALLWPRPKPGEARRGTYKKRQNKKSL